MLEGPINLQQTKFIYTVHTRSIQNRDRENRRRGEEKDDGGRRGEKRSSKYERGDRRRKESRQKEEQNDNVTETISTLYSHKFVALCYIPSMLSKEIKQETKHSGTAINGDINDQSTIDQLLGCTTRYCPLFHLIGGIHYYLNQCYRFMMYLVVYEIVTISLVLVKIL